MSIVDSFPKGWDPRPIQTYILNQIEEKLNSGCKKIIISAPTGVGKSPIAVSLSKHLKSSFVVTASKQLQDQYSNEFKILKPIKGKSNFPCLKIMENKGVKKDDFAQAMKMRMTCNKGRCQEKVNGVTENCEFKSKIQKFEDESFDDTICPYYAQKYEALISPYSLWNYHAYFQIMKYNQRSYGEYLKRAIGIFDEAHKIEDQIIQFIEIKITRKNVEECGININEYDLSDIELIRTLLDNMARYYSEQINILRDTPGFYENPNYDLLNYLESNYDRFVKASIEIYSDKENFIIEEPKKDNGKFLSVVIKPLDISKYVQAFFQMPIQVFMSATIDKSSFCETMGIPLSEVEIIDTPKSPFPYENRKIDFLNVKRLGYKVPIEDELEVIKKIDELLTSHKNHRGLILTSSIYRCFQIEKNLSQENQKRIKICHSENANGKTQNEILKDHANDANSVLLSSSLWEGVDLKYDLSRFQIIAKVPYPNFTERRVAIKKEKYPLWYTAQTLMKLLQGFGRSIRDKDDWAKTYVLDSTVHYLLSKSKNLVPQAYHDVLGWSKPETELDRYFN